MGKPIKNLTFKVPNSQFNDTGFIVLPIDLQNSNIKSLVRWNPITIKATYKIKVINAKTRKFFRHTLTKIEFTPDNKYVMAFWNPNEAIDALMGISPLIAATTLIMGIISYFGKKNDKKKLEK